MRIALLFLIMTTSLASAIGQKAFESITANMQAQQESWNSGDIDGFMQHYWQSPELRFVSKRGVTRGWDQTKANYHKSYPTSEKMGTLTFDIASHEKLGKGKVLTIGQWTLSYPDSEPVGGWFTLIWEKIDGKWVIVLDHTS